MKLNLITFNLNSYEEEHFYNDSDLAFNAEYEIAWASNSWYKDGWMNSAMGGIGFRF